MFIPQSFLLHFHFILLFIYRLEYVFEQSIIFLKNSVFGGEIKRIVFGKCILETRMSKANNAFPSVIHSHSTTSLTRIFKYLSDLLLLSLRPEYYFKCTWLVSGEVSGSILITKCMSTNTNRISPRGN